jgi:hypothetical protein
MARQTETVGHNVAFLSGKRDVVRVLLDFVVLLKRIVMT